MKRLGAIEALGRGIANVRGNIEVVGVAAGGTIVLTGVILLSLIPWLGLTESELGSLFRVAAGHGQPADLAAVGRQTWAIITNLWGFLLALSIGLTVASIAYSWYLGGILGVLYAGDAQAPPGARRAPELFRTWSTRFFVGEAGRLVWRVFGFLTLWLTIVLGIMAVLVGAVIVAAAVGGSAGGVAGLALGCGAALPLMFVFFAAIGAMSLGQVELVPPEGRVAAASRAGVRWLGRRLGATVAIFALFFVAAIAIAIVEAGVGLAIVTQLAARPAVAFAAQLVLFVVQIVLSSLLNLVLAAAFVALVRGERRLEPDPVA